MYTIVYHQYPNVHLNVPYYYLCDNDVITHLYYLMILMSKI